MRSWLWQDCSACGPEPEGETVACVERFEAEQEAASKRSSRRKAEQLMLRFEFPTPGLLLEDPPMEFPVVIQKSYPEEPTNLSIDVTDGFTLHVREVLEGPVTEWNRRYGAAIHRDIRVFDRIFEVNGVRGDSTQLLEAMSTTTLELMVRRPKEFRLTLDKPRKGAPLGLTLGRAEQGVKGDPEPLIIQDVNRDSLVDDWNKANWEHRIRRGDRILEVNGRRGAPKEMMRVMAQDEALSLVLEH